MKENLAFVLDFDGIFTDGKMYYSKDGKVMKAVGCDDWELIKGLSEYIPVTIITADERGFPITRKRIEEEMHMELYLVREKAKGRWEWIKNKYPTQKIIFMGDSLSDYYSLKSADLGITVMDALDVVKGNADVVIPRRGGDRAVAEAVLYINTKYNIFNVYDLVEQKEKHK